jgi:hypothetical protein
MDILETISDIVASAPDDETAVLWVGDYLSEKNDRIVTRSEAQRMIERAQKAQH